MVALDDAHEAHLREQIIRHEERKKAKAAHEAHLLEQMWLKAYEKEMARQLRLLEEKERREKAVKIYALLDGLPRWSLRDELIEAAKQLFVAFFVAVWELHISDWQSSPYLEEQ